MKRFFLSILLFLIGALFMYVLMTYIKKPNFDPKPENEIGLNVIAWNKEVIVEQIGGDNFSPAYLNHKFWEKTWLTVTFNYNSAEFHGSAELLLETIDEYGNIIQLTKNCYIEQGRHSFSMKKIHMISERWHSITYKVENGQNYLFEDSWEISKANFPREIKEVNILRVRLIKTGT